MSEYTPVIGESVGAGRDDGTMTRVVSLGSINVDHVVGVDVNELARLAERYDWFPERGRTVRVDTLPDDFAVDADEIRHGGKGANQAVAGAMATRESGARRGVPTLDAVRAFEQ